MRTGKIPIVEVYRNVGIHDRQSFARVEVVKRAIDQVYAMAGDLKALFAYCGQIDRPPESRGLAGALIEASWELAAEERRQRPNFTIADVHARITAWDSEAWRNPWRFCSLLDVRLPGGAEAVERDEPIPEDAEERV